MQDHPKKRNKNKLCSLLKTMSESHFLKNLFFSFSRTLVIRQTDAQEQKHSSSVLSELPGPPGGLGGSHITGFVLPASAPSEQRRASLVCGPSRVLGHLNLTTPTSSGPLGGPKAPKYNKSPKQKRAAVSLMPESLHFKNTIMLMPGIICHPGSDLMRPFSGVCVWGVR